MTTEVRDGAAKNGVVRRHATGVMRPAAVGPESADLAAMVRQVAELARTRPEPPSRIRLEHLGIVLEIEWPSAAAAALAASATSAGGGRVAASVSAGAATTAAPAVSSAAASPASPASSSVSGAGAGVAESAAPHPVPPEADSRIQHICAPMIGTFYHSPEPGAPPFVAVGDTVVPGQRIGILEVMKMMSPVEAQVAGIVKEILVPDGAAVEFQQPLIAVEGAGEH